MPWFQSRNSCNESSRGFLRHKLFSGMVWKSFRYWLLLITSLLNQWINPAQVKFDLEPNQANLKKFNWAKITTWKVCGFFETGELRWFPEIKDLHADLGSPSKKFLLIESPRNQNRIVLRNVKLIWFGWWKMWVSKSNWRYGNCLLYTSPSPRD